MARLLSLPAEPYRPCLRSGYCCKQGVCLFGSWDEEAGQCAYLRGDEPGSYSCAKKDEIEKLPLADVSPAFGAGCCSPLNSDRTTLQESERVHVQAHQARDIRAEHE